MVGVTAVVYSAATSEALGECKHDLRVNSACFVGGEGGDEAVATCSDDKSIRFFRSEGGALLVSKSVSSCVSVCVCLCPCMCLLSSYWCVRAYQCVRVSVCLYLSVCVSWCLGLSVSLACLSVCLSVGRCVCLSVVT